MRIAVRAPNWLGDAVLSTPALRDLRATFPGAEIDAYAVAAAAEVYRRLPDPPRVIDLPPRTHRVALFRRGLAALGDRPADGAIVFPPSFSSALLFALARVPNRVGMAGRGRLLSCSVASGPRERVPLAETHRRLVGALANRLGVPARREESRARLSIGEDDRAEAHARLGEVAFPLVVLAPGAVYGPTKRWPPASFAALADRLHEELGAHVVLTGGAGDRAVCAEVGERARVPVRSIAGETTLGALAAVFASASLVVSNDSGAMHLASVAGAPVVAIFGSTNPAWTAPIGGEVTIVRRHEPCAPCYRPSCAIGIVCLTRIEVEEVFVACRERLRQ